MNTLILVKLEGRYVIYDKYIVHQRSSMLCGGDTSRPRGPISFYVLSSRPTLTRKTGGKILRSFFLLFIRARLFGELISCSAHTSAVTLPGLWIENTCSFPLLKNLHFIRLRSCCLETYLINKTSLVLFQLASDVF